MKPGQWCRYYDRFSKRWKLGQVSSITNNANLIVKTIVRNSEVYTKVNEIDIKKTGEQLEDVLEVGDVVEIEITEDYYKYPINSKYSGVLKMHLSDMLDFGNHAVFHYDDFKVIAVELHENRRLIRQVL